MSNARTDTLSTDQRAAENQRNRREVIREGFKNKTRGEAWFNGISYIGVGYGLVTGVSVFLTWLMRDTKGNFAKSFEKIAEAATKKFGFSRSITSIATLFVGGTLASVFPVKWLEDAKPQIVKKLDRVILSDDEFESQKVKNAHKELEELPKQTWLSVFGSRVVAFAATFGVYALMGSNKSPIAKATGHSLDEASIRFGRWADRFLNRNNPDVIAKIDAAIATNLSRMKSTGADALSGLEVVRKGAAVDRVQTKVWSYIGIDAFYTLITSATLFISTRVLGGLIGKPRVPADPAPLPRHTPRDASLHDSSPQPVTTPGDVEKPGAKVQNFSHLERVAQPAPSLELTT